MSSTEDDLIPVTDKIRDLSQNELEKLCLKLSKRDSSGRLYFKLAAEHLGIAEDVVKQVENLENPGFAIVKHWMEKECDSTIKVLRDEFALGLKRGDFVSELDIIRKDVVMLTVTLQDCDGREIRDLSGRFSGSTQFVNNIRPKIRDVNLTPFMRPGSSKKSVAIVQMCKTSCDRYWTSPCRNFKGAHVFLKILQDPSQIQTRCSDIPKSQVPFITEGRRRVVSAATDDMLFFIDDSVVDDQPMVQATYDHPAKGAPSCVDNSIAAAITSDTGRCAGAAPVLMRSPNRSLDSQRLLRIPQINKQNDGEGERYPTSTNAPVQESEPVQFIPASLSARVAYGGHSMLSTGTLAVSVVDSGDDSSHPSQSDA